MERENTAIDLGAAAEQTKGPPGTLYMEDVLFRNDPGLSDD